MLQPKSTKICGPSEIWMFMIFCIENKNREESNSKPNGMDDA